MVRVMEIARDEYLEQVKKIQVVFFNTKKKFEFFIQIYTKGYFFKEGSIIGKMGWAVNSIAMCFYEFESLASYKGINKL